MRMFAGCLPLGCSFDTPTEYLYLKNKWDSQDAAAKWIKENVKQPEQKTEETENGKQ